MEWMLTIWKSEWYASGWTFEENHEVEERELADVDDLVRQEDVACLDVWPWDGAA